MSVNHSEIFETLIDQIQLEFDSVVESGTDDELFIAGYLNGHFSLVAAQCLNQQRLDLQALDEAMQSSLNHAFSNQELEEPDQIKAKSFWRSCVEKFGG